jgi:hypothetical protein
MARSCSGLRVSCDCMAHCVAEHTCISTCPDAKRGKELIGAYPMAPNVDHLVTGGAVNGGVVA